MKKITFFIVATFFSVAAFCQEKMPTDSVAMHTRESLDYSLKWIALFSGILTILFGLYNFFLSTKQRKKELRWKQSEMARQIINEMHNHEKCRSAVDMLDWLWIDKLDLPITKNKEDPFTYSEVLETLPRVRENNLSEKQQIILQCFDWFFYFIDRIEQEIEAKFILYEDVYWIFKSYALKIKENKKIYDNYMMEREYELAPKFWQRFSN